MQERLNVSQSIRNSSKNDILNKQRDQLRTLTPQMELLNNFNDSLLKKWWKYKQ